jgi:murein DD-endopeptidase MepM/ murein hydrolase activator NlpD
MGLRRPSRLRPYASLLALALIFGACAGLQAPLHPPGPDGTWYVVKRGETLAQIAGREGVPLEDLAEINGLRRAAKLEEGQIIFLLDRDGLARPAGASAAVAPSPSAPPAESPPPGGAILRWPLQDPRMSSPFGQRQGRVHEGIDLAAPTGTPIYAARDGAVLYAGDAVRGYGNMVVLQHEQDLLTVYAHSSIVLVHIGDRVRAGQEIARVGQSGRATAPHLHFEVRKGQVPQDPVGFLPGR